MRIVTLHLAAATCLISAQGALAQWDVTSYSNNIDNGEIARVADETGAVALELGCGEDFSGSVASIKLTSLSDATLAEGNMSVTVDGSRFGPFPAAVAESAEGEPAVGVAATTDIYEVDTLDRIIAVLDAVHMATKSLMIDHDGDQYTFTTEGARDALDQMNKC